MRCWTMWAVFFLTAISCSNYTSGDVLPVEVNRPVETSIDVPKDTTVCELKNNPASFDGKLIQVTAFVSRGFEDSNLFDPTCSSSDVSIWVEIGGKAGTGVMYCCGAPAQRSRSETLEVEKIEIPLVDDEGYRDFDRLLQENGNSIVRARMIGRFFAGEKHDTAVGERWGGFGHFGMSSLFVVQQVFEVFPQNRNGFDTLSSHVPDDEGCDSYSNLWDIRQTEVIQTQIRVNQNETTWRVDDPKRVALEALTSVIKRKPYRGIDLKESKRSNGRILYRWAPNGKKGIRYIVLVSRPYWLTFYATQPEKTMWVVSDVISLCD